ncbi:MAG: TonB-dependent siderophore receptor, partial [Rubrivivax sp.]
MLYLGLLLAATGAHAREASDTQHTAVQAKQLDTVLVEGERLQLNLEQDAGLGALGGKRLLDTPFSVTVVDREDIARRQATTLGQVFINDPSVYAAEPSASTNWWGTQIRGIGVQNHYVDGVPMLMEWGGQFPLETVESVQALKGLGGFMYGFGSPGGIISYQTKQPTDATLFATTVGYRNESVFSAQVDAGGRFKGPGSTGYRLNAAMEKGDAYNGAGIDRKVFALAVDQPIGDSLTLRAGVTYEDSTLKHEPLYFYWDAYEGDRLPTPVYDYENVRVGNSSYKSETLHATAGLEWRINEAWKADLSLGQSRREHYSDKMFAELLNEQGDYTGYVYDFAAVLRSEVAQLVLSGNMSTGPVRHDLVFGVSHQRSTDQWSNEFYYSNDFDGNLYQRQTFLSAHTPDFSLSPVSSDLRQQAVFASDTLHFGDHWQAILGARYVDYEQRDLDGDPDTDSRYATSTVTPTVALVYKPIEDLSIYGSYVESLEPGSRVGNDAIPPYENAGETLDPTT